MKPPNSTSTGFSIPLSMEANEDLGYLQSLVHNISSYTIVEAKKF
jgi:hypothetical protein